MRVDISTTIFLITKSRVVFQVNKNECYYIRELNSNIEIELDTYIDIISEIDNRLFMRYNNGKGLILENNSIKTIDKEIEFSYSNEKTINYAIIFKGNIFNRSYGIFNFQTQVPELINFFYGEINVRNFFLGHHNNMLYFYDLTKLL